MPRKGIEVGHGSHLFAQGHLEDRVCGDSELPVHAKVRPHQRDRVVPAVSTPG